MLSRHDREATVNPSDGPIGDRHDILAEIRRRYGSLRKFARLQDMDPSHFSVALERPYPKAEKIISDCLGIPLPQLWPDRYHADGRRRRNASRADGRRAIQKAAAGRVA